MVKAANIQKWLLAAAVFTAALAAASGAHAARFGFADDAGKYADDGGAAFFSDLKAAGGTENRITIHWDPKRPETILEESFLDRSVPVAQAKGIRVVFHVFPIRPTALSSSPDAAESFAAFLTKLATTYPDVRDFIVGNEPNLNRFWLPQFGPGGENVAARDYLALLAETYDALKEVSPDIRVIGGATAPRGGDDPESSRQTHSPTTFIRDLGRFYRESGRETPVMDAYAHHPYLERSELPPDFAHPNSTTIALADYDKLVELLEEAFDGTAQEGGDLPILYTEFGVQTEIPEEKLDAYTNLESPVANDAVPESTQEEYYRQAFELVCDQDNVEGLYIFHVWDEPDLLGWQSGLYYPDRTPKSSRDALIALPSCS